MKYQQTTSAIFFFSLYSMLDIQKQFLVDGDFQHLPTWTPETTTKAQAQSSQTYALYISAKLFIREDVY